MFLNKLDYSYIAPGIYQGSRPSNSLQLINDKFTVLVLSAVEFQPQDSRYKNIKIIKAPIRDSYDITNEEVNKAITCSNAVCKDIVSGGKALITCYMGWNRSGLITAFCLINLYKMNGRQAVNHIKFMRKNSLNNEVFVKIIENYGARRNLK